MHKSDYSGKSLILIFAGFLVVGFIGVLAGNWFMGWRNAEAKEDFMKNHKGREGFLLKENDIFPDISLLDSDGLPVNSNDVLMGKKTAILFFSPSCGPCKGAIQGWGNYSDEIPSDFQVVAITNDFPEGAYEYLSDNNFPFPFYCDTGMVMLKKYEVNRYPSVMCLNENMEIVLPYRSPYNKFSPLDAYAVLSQANK